MPSMDWALFIHYILNLQIRKWSLQNLPRVTQADISKSRDITLPTKVRLVKAMVFPVVMYGCES